MGYTHYWRRPEQLPAEPFNWAAGDVRSVLAAAGVPLAGLKGTGETVVDGEQITFNGTGGQACEPFLITRVQFDRRGRGAVSSCCKTERLPYDRCVKAALIVLKHHLGNSFKVASDGDESEWDEAKAFIQSTLGFGEAFRLDAE